MLNDSQAEKPSRRDVLKLGVATIGSIMVKPWAMAFSQELPSEYPTYVEVQSNARRTIALNGDWLFRLDPRDRGIGEQWFSRGRTFDDTIVVPGTWQGQGFGQAYQIPQSERKIGSEVGPQTQFLGTAWYKREVTVPPLRKRQRVWLKIGAVNPAATIWVNGERVGDVTQPGIPTRFDITDHIKPGQKTDITARVYERNRALNYWYNLMASWSGLWRSVKLEITREAWIHDLRVLPDFDRSVAVINAELRGALASNAVVHAEIPGIGRVSHRVSREGAVSLEMRIPNARPWSPQDPHLYSVHVSLTDGNEQVDHASVRFGMRKIEARGNQMYLNNEPVLFRCFGDDAMFPATLHPETNPQILRQRLAAAKSLGFNAAYPCAYMPADEFLDAADEIGMLVQFDIPAVIALQRGDLGDAPEDRAEEKRLIREQWLASLRWTQNHPALVIYAPGSEIFPDNPHVAELYQLARQSDPTRLVMSWSGLRGATDIADVGTLYEPMDPSEQLHLQMAGDQWRDSRGIPGIAHEYGAAECLLDPKDIPLYGHGLNPLLETEVLQAAKARGIAHLLPALVENSRKLQALCRRFQVEEARKVPHLAGYKIWLIQDIPGYPQGIFDPFGAEKVANAGELARSNAETVLLMNEQSNRTRRTFASNETALFEIFASHYGSRRLENLILRWSISDSEHRILASGQVTAPEVVPFTVAKLTNLQISMPSVTRPQATQLSLSLHNNVSTIHNEWTIWLFPQSSSLHTDVMGYGLPRLESLPPLRDWDGKATDLLVTGKLDGLVSQYLAAGGKVLLLLEASDSLLHSKAVVHTQFMPRWPLTGGRDVSCTLVDRHLALGDFPHGGFCDYQFYNLIVYPTGSLPTHPMTAKRPLYSRGLGVAINLDKFAQRVDPIIRVFGTNENRAYICEMGVEKGRLLATTLRIAHTTEFPESRWLLQQLVAYTEGNEFKPTVTLKLDDVRRWFSQV